MIKIDYSIRPFVIANREGKRCGNCRRKCHVNDEVTSHPKRRCLWFPLSVALPQERSTKLARAGHRSDAQRPCLLWGARDGEECSRRFEFSFWVRCHSAPAVGRARTPEASAARCDNRPLSRGCAAICALPPQSARPAWRLPGSPLCVFLSSASAHHTCRFVRRIPRLGRRLS